MKPRMALTTAPALVPAVIILAASVAIERCRLVPATMLPTSSLQSARSGCRSPQVALARAERRTQDLQRPSRTDLCVRIFADDRAQARLGLAVPRSGPAHAVHGRDVGRVAACDPCRQPPRRLQRGQLP